MKPSEIYHPKISFEEFVNQSLTGSESQVRNLMHITGLTEKLTRTEFELARDLAILIDKKVFLLDDKDSSVISRFIDTHINSKKGGTTKYRVYAIHAINKVFPSCRPILQLAYQKLIDDGYFQSNSNITNLRALGIWFRFANEELQDYFSHYKRPEHPNKSRFFEEAEIFYCQG